MLVLVIVVKAVAVVVLGGSAGAWLMQGDRVGGSIGDKEFIVL